MKAKRQGESKLRKVFRHPFRFICQVIWRRFFQHKVTNEKKYVRWDMFCNLGYFPNLDKPKTYNEKIGWLKLNYRNPIMTTMVDKYAVKEFVDLRLGTGHVFECLGVYNSFDEICFDDLPEKFVLKTTHDSFGHPLIVEKNSLDDETMKRIKSKLEQSLSKNAWKEHLEWAYKDVPRRIIAEPFMTDDSGVELKDYKFFCFNGEVKYCWAGSNFNPEWHFDFFDMDWNALPCRYGYDNAPEKVEKPRNLDEMINVAKTLSAGLPHVRVDLYSIKGTIYLGELTFYTWAGIMPFEPRSFDRFFGDLLDLDTVAPMYE